jgi:hypothetical protein
VVGWEEGVEGVKSVGRFFLGKEERDEIPAWTYLMMMLGIYRIENVTNRRCHE